MNLQNVQNLGTEVVKTKSAIDISEVLLAVLHVLLGTVQIRYHTLGIFTAPSPLGTLPQPKFQLSSCVK